MNLVSILLAAAGGAAGAALRFCLAELVLRHAAGCRFPVATFAVNLAGCLLAGLLSGLADRYGFFSIQERVFLFTGLLGGFTTFSAFLVWKRSPYCVSTDFFRPQAMCWGAFAVACSLYGLVAI